MGKHTTPRRLALAKTPVYDHEMQRIPWSKVDAIEGVLVYTLNFTDGAVYAGISKDLRHRVSVHKSKPSNRAVHVRLANQGLAYIQVLTVCPTHQEAHPQELRVIRNLQDNRRNVLNMMVALSPPGYAKQSGIATEDMTFKCRICKEVKNATEFYRDRSRSCGRASKCKICANRASQILVTAKRLGIDSPSVFQLFRENPNLTYKTFPWELFGNYNG